MDEIVKELEYQYSPSRWSRRYGADEIIEKHVEFATNESNNNKNDIQCELNIRYGDSDGQKFDIFGTDLSDESPIFLYIHGGYWQALSRNISSYVVKPFYNNGVKVIILGYDLCPAVTFAELVEQVRGGFNKCLEYAAGAKSPGIFLAGHSAGAHLVSSLFMNNSETINKYEHVVKGVFLFSGVYNLVPLTNTYVNVPLKLSNSLAIKFSPLHQELRWGQNVKFYVLVGEYESDEFHQQSKLYYHKVKNLGRIVRFLEVEDVDHFDIVEKLSDEKYSVTTLILKEILGLQ